MGTAAMLIPILIQSVWYKIKLWKSVPIAVLLTATGTFGTYIWYFIENRSLGGISFYGAVFTVPLLFLLIAFLLREPFGRLTDLCAPAECVMLMIMKFQCLLSGCCGGRVLYTTADGIAVRFPSQIVELVNAFVIALVLMFLAYKKPKRGDLYPLYMLIYGITRFVLNLFREAQSDFFLGMSPGNVWSLLAIATGTVWLIILKKRATNPNRRS